MIDNLKELYDDWVNSSIKFVQSENFIEIQTPFVDMHHDYIHLILINNGNKYTISDDGSVLNELEMLGVNVTNTKKRKKYFERKLKVFGVKYNPGTGELYISFDNLSEYPKKQHNLIQCMIQISDMLLTSRNSVSNIFTDDIKRFFDIEDIIYISDLGFNGQSGNQQTFDFVIPHRKEKKEKIIKAVNKPTSQNYTNTVFPFIDIGEVRDDSEYFVLANDGKQNISDKFITSLENWNVTVLAWSDKGSIVDTFKVI